MKPFYVFYLFFVLVSFSIAPSFGQAQIVEDLVGENLYLEASDEYPQPNSYVEVTLNDYAYGRTVSSITWYVNGVEMLSAKNQRKVLVLMGEIGDAQEVVAEVTSGTTKDSVAVVLRPVHTDIIIEAETRSPGFYKGRSLPSSGGSVSATVIIDGLSTSQQDLLYDWSVDDAPIASGVIRGKNKVGFYVSEYSSSFLLGVTVSDLNGVMVAKRIIEVPIVEAEVLFYETTSLYGLRPIAISNLIFSGETAAVQAEPYNLAVNTFNKPDYLAWTINNTETKNTSTNPYEITLQRSGTGTSYSQIGFHVRDLAKLLQGAEGEFDIKL